MTTGAIKALHLYRARADERHRAENATIRGAIVLTPAQQRAISKALTTYWGRQYLCPRNLDIKPRHGYESRVGKDGFTSLEFVEWVVTGCSDCAVVETDGRGRPRLAVRGVRNDVHETVFDVHVLIGSDTFGYVHVFDVIPKGLESRRKKQPPRRSLRPSDLRTRSYRAL